MTFRTGRRLAFAQRGSPPAGATAQPNKPIKSGILRLPPSLWCRAGGPQQPCKVRETLGTIDPPQLIIYFLPFCRGNSIHAEEWRRKKQLDHIGGRGMRIWRIAKLSTLISVILPTTIWGQSAPS